MRDDSFSMYGIVSRYRNIVSSGISTPCDRHVYTEFLRCATRIPEFLESSNLYKHNPALREKMPTSYGVEFIIALLFYAVINRFLVCSNWNIHHLKLPENNFSPWPCWCGISRINFIRTRIICLLWRLANWRYFHEIRVLLCTMISRL